MTFRKCASARELEGVVVSLLLKKKQRSYKIREKWDTVRRMQEVGVQEVARELLCARCTAHGWWQQADKLMSFIGHVTSKTMKGRDVRNCCPTSLPSMKDKRRNKLQMPEATMKSTGAYKSCGD
ncbi:uncharacterized protein PITG_10286 [Phytophthora infestans T30-4]|uniref:Uncharacterized protein n=1 Tax=Phytophthora infestans (strain T30-4) TaxID=403677 RepID=D0NEZ1_PHYIT|nr:uncharacterized protein PITG_10286 [Phytophthora infestans T30-4]EEY56780.1 hypothetical protein PITG_10286 [Phytophthora infestans T30-4]|eukprot:XP_002902108.1 hypothetical protein PITG_10286 [Phytophthora infestans T30-4]